jgi:hypothetical protein
MKKNLMILLMLTATIGLRAQDKKNDLINPFGRLEYQVYVQGNVLTYFFQQHTSGNNALKIHWQSASGREGYYLMTRLALDSARYGFWNPPQPGDIELENDQLVLLISKYNYQRLKKEGKMQYDGNYFNIIPSAANSSYKMGDKIVNCLYAATADGGTKIWILDNPEFPLFLKIEGNPFGVDAELTGIR